MTVRPYLRLLEAAAQTLGGRVVFDPRYRHTGWYTTAAGRPFPLFGNALGLNSDAAAALATDKTHAADMLGKAGLSVPQAVLVMTEPARSALLRKHPRMEVPDAAQALTFAKAHDYGVFLKPNTGKAGEDVRHSTDVNSFHQAFADLSRNHSHIRIEAAVAGADYRVLVLNGVARAAYLRRPFGLMGDGRTTVGDLLRHALRTVTSHGFIDDSDPALPLLDLNSILPSGTFVPLRANANLSTGGSLADLSANIPDALAQIAGQAAAAIGLRYAGVDILCSDPQNPATMTVLEVNSSPGLDSFASHGPAQWARSLEILTDALSCLGEGM